MEQCKDNYAKPGRTDLELDAVNMETSGEIQKAGGMAKRSSTIFCGLKNGNMGVRRPMNTYSVQYKVYNKKLKCGITSACELCKFSARIKAECKAMTGTLNVLHDFSNHLCIHPVS